VVGGAGLMGLRGAQAPLARRADPSNDRFMEWPGRSTWKWRINGEPLLRELPRKEVIQPHLPVPVSYTH
jgi:hypothetical protein